MFSLLCGAGQRVCDLCEQPAIKGIDTKLMPHSLVHDTCLIDQFPGFADEHLHMRNPRSLTSFFTLEQIRERLINAAPGKRNVYFKILDRVLGERYDQLPVATKISLLTDVAMIMPRRDDDRRPHLQIGLRPLGRHDCLELALELALEHQPESISRISQHLFDLQPVYPTVSLFGVNFKRSRVLAWAAGRDLPESTQATVYQDHLDAELSRDDQENVHAGPMIRHGMQQIIKMQCRGDQMLSDAETNRQIDAYLRRHDVSQSAMNGLRRVREGHEVVPHFHITLGAASAIVWHYINAQTDPALAENLRRAFLSRLVDIGETRPCALGMLQRLIDTPTAVDFSMAPQTSTQALRDDVAAIAAEVNEEFEALYGEGTETRPPPTVPQASDVVQAPIASEIKRAMVMQRAQVELVVLRKLAPEPVHAAIDLVFPAGLVL